MPRSVKNPSFEQQCYESLPFVKIVNDYWIKSSESDLQQRTDAEKSKEDVYSHPTTQAALKVAVITNILLIGLPCLLLWGAERSKRGISEARAPLDIPFCACVLIVCNVLSGVLSIVPAIILHLFNKIKENRQESTPLLSAQGTGSPDPDLDNCATAPQP